MSLLHQYCNVFFFTSTNVTDRVHVCITLCREVLGQYWEAKYYSVWSIKLWVVQCAVLCHFPNHSIPSPVVLLWSTQCGLNSMRPLFPASASLSSVVTTMRNPHRTVLAVFLFVLRKHGVSLWRTRSKCRLNRLPCSSDSSEIRVCRVVVMLMIAHSLPPFPPSLTLLSKLFFANSFPLFFNWL